MKGRGLVITGGMVLALLLWAAVQFLIGVSARIFKPEEFDIERTGFYFFLTLFLALAFYLLNRAKKWIDQP